MSIFATFALFLMITLSVVFLGVAVALWVAGKRIEVRIKELDSQLGGSTNHTT